MREAQSLGCSRTAKTLRVRSAEPSDRAWPYLTDFFAEILARNFELARGRVEDAGGGLVQHARLVSAEHAILDGHDRFGSGPGKDGDRTASAGGAGPSEHRVHELRLRVDVALAQKPIGGLYVRDAGQAQLLR